MDSHLLTPVITDMTDASNGQGGALLKWIGATD